LIVDAYRALSAYVRAVDTPDAPIDARIEAAMLAYRAWAVAHPAEYALLFGTPIPGYHAPAELTTPEAQATLAAFGDLFVRAHGEGRLLSEAEAPPPSIIAHAMARHADRDQEMPLHVLLITLRAWGLGHGLIGLELDHHLQPIIGDASALYAYEVRRMLRELGVRR
jgi:hypothetical protein